MAAGYQVSLVPGHTIRPMVSVPWAGHPAFWKPLKTLLMDVFNASTTLA